MILSGGVASGCPRWGDLRRRREEQEGGQTEVRLGDSGQEVLCHLSRGVQCAAAGATHECRYGGDDSGGDDSDGDDSDGDSVHLFLV